MCHADFVIKSKTGVCEAGSSSHAKASLNVFPRHMPGEHFTSCWSLQSSSSSLNRQGLFPATWARGAMHWTPFTEPAVHCALVDPSSCLVHRS